MTELPTPHFNKLTALINNDGIQRETKSEINSAIEHYHDWIKNINLIESKDKNKFKKLITLFNEYKFYIDFNLIFSSKDDFLYRQKGQLKIDNTIIEEFLPLLVDKMFPNLDEDILLGPMSCLSQIFIDLETMKSNEIDSVKVKHKDQDFVIGKKVELTTTTGASSNSVVAFFAAECKTNLDKTMFQEASATASDIKKLAPGCKYILLCEWLDMKPINSAGTSIDEVIILRKAKRISSNTRSEYNSYAGRKKSLVKHKNFLLDNPFDIEMFERIIKHIDTLNVESPLLDEDVLNRGFF